jgi:aconitate hydratase
MSPYDPYQIRGTFKTAFGTYTYYCLTDFAKTQTIDLGRLPFSIRILLENALRKLDGENLREEDVESLAQWQPGEVNRPAVPFHPGRVLLQDFTGVPVIVDLAAMRSAVARLGGDPTFINPVLPVDLVIDHSVQVDSAGLPDSLQRNVEKEYERNRERYQFLHWGQRVFKNLRIVPPSSGIIHQVNLEYLAQVVLTRDNDGEVLAFPDTLVGSDSHTTMINGLGVLGWGVGGIEATAAMLGQALDVVIPDVVGVHLIGSLREGVTPTDLTLTLTQLLRQQGVVNKFVEYFGSGLSALSLADRAMVANMTPENGSTIGYFPVDNQTMEYLRLSGRSPEQVALVEAYFREQGLFRTDETPDPEFSSVLELDLGSIEPSLAGPRRPQDRLPLGEVNPNFHQYLTQPKTTNGLGLDAKTKASLTLNGQKIEMKQGAVVIAAITSCTNTSNPFVMIAAGLLAKKAVARGLSVHPYVKTSLTPGSRVVSAYLQSARLRHLHRQQRSARRRSNANDQREQAGSSCPSLREPQLRRASAPIGAGQLSGFARVGGGLRPGWNCRHRPATRSHRNGPAGTAGIPARAMAKQCRGQRGYRGPRASGTLQSQLCRPVQWRRRLEEHRQSGLRPV